MTGRVSGGFWNELSKEFGKRRANPDDVAIAPVVELLVIDWLDTDVTMVLFSSPLSIVIANIMDAKPATINWKVT